MTALSRKEFERIDRALATVLDSHDGFSEFHVDFAFRMGWLA